MGIGFPEPRPSVTLTDATIISELDPLKEEAGMVQGVVARQSKKRGVTLRGSYLTIFPFMDKLRFWQAVRNKASFFY
jgi:hypothetical protein